MGFERDAGNVTIPSHEKRDETQMGIERGAGDITIPSYEDNLCMTRMI